MAPTATMWTHWSPAPSRSWPTTTLRARSPRLSVLTARRPRRRLHGLNRRSGGLPSKRPSPACSKWRRRARQNSGGIMIRLLFAFALIALIALGAVWLSDHPGDVRIAWGGWVIETSALVIATAALLFAALVALLYRFWIWLKMSPGRIGD